jgi:hypothetical protein
MPDPIRRGDMIIPEILLDAMAGAFAGMKIMGATGAATVQPTLPNEKRGGDTVKVPYFGIFGELEDVAEGVPLVPQKLGMTEQDAHVQHSGKAFQMTTWTQLAAAYADPYGEAARQLVELVARRADRALIEIASDPTDLPPSQLVDVTVGAPKGGGGLSYDAFVQAKLGFGDEQRDIVGLAVHSNVLGQMYALKDGFGRPLLIDSARDGELPQFLGVPTFVSDRLPLDTTGPRPVYTSLLLKKNAMAYWFNAGNMPETLRDPLTDSTIVATHVYWVGYRYRHLPGFSRPGVVQLRTF